MFVFALGITEMAFLPHGSGAYGTRVGVRRCWRHASSVFVGGGGGLLGPILCDANAVWCEMEEDITTNTTATRAEGLPILHVRRGCLLYTSRGGHNTRETGNCGSLEALPERKPGCITERIAEEMRVH